MSVLFFILKIFITIALTGGILGGIFQIWLAQKKPDYGTIVGTIAGVIVLVLCLYGVYYVWFN